MPAAGAIGEMTEELEIQTSEPQPIRVTSLTRSGAVATCITERPHGFVTGDYASIEGANQAGYNLNPLVTVLSPTSFSYAVDSGTVTPATGHIRVAYFSDEMGGKEKRWSTIDTIAAELVSPQSGNQQIQADALQARSTHAFRVWVAPHISAGMRARWVHSASGRDVTLNIKSVVPDTQDPRSFMILEAGA